MQVLLVIMPYNASEVLYAECLFLRCMRLHLAALAITVLDATLPLRQSEFPSRWINARILHGLCLVIRMACEVRRSFMGKLHSDPFGGNSADASWVRGKILDVSGLRVFVEMPARRPL